MSHDINHEFPASSHTVTPLPETSGIIGKVISSIKTRGLRYALVAAVNVIVGQSLLLLLQGVFRPSWANLVAVGISAVPAYYMNRAWVWGKRGKSHWKREVLPFWLFTVAGLILSTGAIWVVHRFTDAKLVINLVQLVAFGILWVIRFFVLDRLFHVEVFEDDLPDED
ncbi:MAG: GtrA family protein [Actinomycetes bacterium]